MSFQGEASEHLQRLGLVVEEAVDQAVAGGGASRVAVGEVDQPCVPDVRCGVHAGSNISAQQTGGAPDQAPSCACSPRLSWMRSGYSCKNRQRTCRGLCLSQYNEETFKQQDMAWQAGFAKCAPVGCQVGRVLRHTWCRVPKGRAGVNWSAALLCGLHANGQNNLQPGARRMHDALHMRRRCRHEIAA